MIEGMGVQWAGTLLGCVAFALVPLPVWFYLRGAKLREKSNFAPTFGAANQDNHPKSDTSEDEENVVGLGDGHGVAEVVPQAEVREKAE